MRTVRRIAVIICALTGLGLMEGCARTGAISDPVRVVGSSTIFPFAAMAAERYSDRTGVSVVVEQTGSGGGHKLFCSGDPDIDATTSSRPRKPSEAALCETNGVTPVLGVRLGSDGIVLAQSVSAEPMNLAVSHLYRALARTLPAAPDDCTPVSNPNRLWSDISPDLPTRPIEVHGPPPTSGTRDAFVETALEAGARDYPCLVELERVTPNLFRARAHTLREDGSWIDAGENDAALIRTLANRPAALGVFGFSFLDRNSDRVRSVSIGGVTPTPEAIRSRAYPVVRDLYLYLREDADPQVVGYALEFTSDDAAAPGGYLEAIGLIPLPDPDRQNVRRTLLSVIQPDGEGT